MLVKTKGIVFRSIKYSETSIITDIFTRELGLRSYIVNGVRKAKPKFSHSLFQIMTQVYLLAYDHTHKNLNRVKEISADKTYIETPFNIIKSSIGTFMIELCQKSIKEREPNLEMYDFLSDWFFFLDEYKGSLAHFHLLFMVEFSAMLGFQPMVNYLSGTNKYFNLQEGFFSSSFADSRYMMDEESSQYFYQLTQINRTDFENIQIPKKIRIKLIDYLVLFYQLHIENFPPLNSVSVLSEVLS